jgi:hypothetical protein
MTELDAKAVTAFFDRVAGDWDTMRLDHSACSDASNPRPRSRSPTSTSSPHTPA